VQRQSLQLWLDDFVRPWLYERIIPVSESIAEATGRIAGERDAAGRPLGFPDAAIAATAIENNFTLVTRNVKDFSNLPVPIINLWDTQGTPS
jgi:predicted nucleic acid-binding protein